MAGIELSITDKFSIIGYSVCNTYEVIICNKPVSLIKMILLLTTLSLEKKEEEQDIYHLKKTLQQTPSIFHAISVEKQQEKPTSSTDILKNGLHDNF